MTFELLNQIIEENHIPHNVRLTSDSGWECGTIDMNAAWYNERENTIVFIQGGIYAGMGYPFPNDVTIDWMIEENKKWKPLYIGGEQLWPNISER